MSRTLPEAHDAIESWKREKKVAISGEFRGNTTQDTESTRKEETELVDKKRES